MLMGKMPDVDKTIRSFEQANEVRKVIAEAVDKGRVKFANPFAEDALATMRMEKSDPEYGLFIDVSIEPWKHGKWRGLVISWSRKGIGFGEISLVEKNGRYFTDTETMGKGFLSEALAWFIKNKVKEKG
jgi:hypothetical protein